MAVSTSVKTTEIGGLVAQLASEDPVQRNSARESLVALGASDVTAALVAELIDPRQQVRWEAAQALNARADPVVAPALVLALEDYNEGVRWLAAEGLIALGNHGVTVVLSALIKRAASTVFCDGAHHVLRACDDKRTVEIVSPVLLALSRSEPGVSVPNAAYKALSEITAVQALRGGR